MWQSARWLQPFRLAASRISEVLIPYRSLLLATTAIIFAGAVVALVARTYEPREQIHVGNTAGSLSALVEVAGHRILIGAGPTRSHSADFVGRSTRPWDRDIDLLIVPGWDDYHAVGALGLLERRGIRGVAVIGIPGDETTWTLLEREAQRNDIPIRYLDSSHQIRLDADSRFKMTELANDQTGAWIRVEHKGLRVDLVDTDAIETATPPSAVFDRRSDHAFVNMRQQNLPGDVSPALLIQPRPFWQGDFDEFDAEHVAGIDRNERVKLTFGDGELRIPLDDLER